MKYEISEESYESEEENEENVKDLEEDSISKEKSGISINEKLDENGIEKLKESNLKKVEILKKESNTDDMLGGAILQLKKGEEEIRIWTTSDKGPEKIQLEDGEYTLIEVSAPEGYEIAEPIKFTVDQLNSDDVVEINDKYIAFNRQEALEEGITYRSLYITPKVEKIDFENKIIVYCYNLLKSYPVSEQVIKNNTHDIYYNKEMATKDSFKDLASNRSKDVENFDNRIKSIIYNGYPYNNIGLKEKYGLSDIEFREVTQNAIWHYTDGGTGVTLKNIAEKDAYNELIQLQKQSDEDVSLYFYKPNNSEYQNLLSIEYAFPNTITMYDVKKEGIIPEEPKEEEPKTEEPKEEEPKKEEPKTEEPKEEEPKTEEPKEEEPKTEKPKEEEPKEEEPKEEEPKEEEPKTEEPKEEEPKEEKPKEEKPKEEKPKIYVSEKKEGKKDKAEEGKKFKTYEEVKYVIKNDNLKVDNENEIDKKVIEEVDHKTKKDYSKNDDTDKDVSDEDRSVNLYKVEKNNDDTSPQTFVGSAYANVSLLGLAIGGLHFINKKRK